MKGKGTRAAGEGGLQRQLLFSFIPTPTAAGLRSRTQAEYTTHLHPNSRALTGDKEALERPELVSQACSLCV